MQHDEAVDAEREAAVRGRAHAERVEQEAEFRLLLGLADARAAWKTRGLESASWIRNEPRAELVAVPDQVVVLASGPPGSASNRSSSPGIGRVNGWWTNVHALLSSSHSKIGKSMIQRNSLRCGSAGRARAPRCVRRRAEHARGHRLVGGREERRLAGVAAKAASSASERNFAIGERTSPPVVHEVGEALGAPLLRELLEPRELAARERARHAR